MLKKVHLRNKGISNEKKTIFEKRKEDFKIESDWSEKVKVEVDER
jgi:hypothetical protein